MSDEMDGFARKPSDANRSFMFLFWKSTHLMSDSDIVGRVNPTGATDLTESLRVISMPLSDSRRALLDERGGGICKITSVPTLVLQCK